MQNKRVNNLAVLKFMMNFWKKLKTYGSKDCLSGKLRSNWEYKKDIFLVEQLTLNQLVTGSIPVRLTI